MQILLSKQIVSVSLHMQYLASMHTYVVFPDPLGPMMAFIPGLIMALKVTHIQIN